MDKKVHQIAMKGQIMRSIYEIRKDIRQVEDQFLRADAEEREPLRARLQQLWREQDARVEFLIDSAEGRA